MPQLPRETVRVILAQEQHIPAARTWAARRSIELSFDEDALSLCLQLEGPPANPAAEPETYRIVGDLDDFDVLPPVWRFVDPRNGSTIGKAGYPQPTGSSVFHGHGLICAPWSRLAYTDAGEGGPHSDWGPQAGWKLAAPGHTRAVTIPDMLDRIYREVRTSRGRMAPLPSLP